MLTSFATDDKVFPAIKAGARGYLLKDSSPEELVRAIRQVHRGEASLDPSIARKVLQELARGSDRPPTPDPLTPREVEVLRLVARGLGNQQIADGLSLSEATVRYARQHDPRQAAPRQPHPGRPLRLARGIGIARRLREQHGVTTHNICRRPSTRNEGEDRRKAVLFAWMNAVLSLMEPAGWSDIPNVDVDGPYSDGKKSGSGLRHGNDCFDWSFGSVLCAAAVDCGHRLGARDCCDDDRCHHGWRRVDR